MLPELDLVDEDDQITHMLTLDEATNRLVLNHINVEVKSIFTRFTSFVNVFSFPYSE